MPLCPVSTWQAGGRNVSVVSRAEAGLQDSPPGGAEPPQNAQR